MTPAAPPARDSRIASARNWPRIWPRVAPSARRSPISERRSSTEITMMLATPMAPTSRATALRPRKRASSAPLASAWAVSASEGWETSTWLGFSGSAWAPSRLSTRVVDLQEARVHAGAGQVGVQGVQVVAGGGGCGGEVAERRNRDAGGDRQAEQDRAVAALDHAGQYLADQRDRGAEQQVEGEVEGGGVRVADSGRVFEQVEPGGCVLQDVDRAESRGDRLGHAGQRVAVGEVAGETGGLDSVRG